AEGSVLWGRPTRTSHLRAPHCEGDPLVSLTCYMGIGGFCTLVPMCICALHIILLLAISLVLCESCVEPPLACSTRSVFFTCLFLFVWYGASTGSARTMW
ncbi:hypothetical protein BKA93DRAFT_786445, partial [Sparassis latifolia]